MKCGKCTTTPQVMHYGRALVDSVPNFASLVESIPIHRKLMCLFMCIENVRTCTKRSITKCNVLYTVQVSRISVIGLTYLAKSSLSVAVSHSMHGKYVRITKLHHSAKWLQHASTVSGVICQKADFRTFLPWSAHSAWNRL